MDEYISSNEIDDVDWNTDDDLDILTSSQPTCNVTNSCEASSSGGGSRSMLMSQFVGMGFPKGLVSRAIEENGEEDTDKILNSILTYSTLEDSPHQQLNTNSPSYSSDHDEAFLDDLSFMEDWTDDEIQDCLQKDTGYKNEQHKMLLSLANAGSLSAKEEKTLALLNMGYTVDEASNAMDRCGAEATVSILTDFICAAQMARAEDPYLPVDDLKPKHVSIVPSKNKRRKLCDMKKHVCINAADGQLHLPNPMIGYGVPSQQPALVRRSLSEEARGPPYFYYENVALTPKGVWETISRFLYDIDPEFVDSKFFCAAARKRGYVHNLPIEGRFPLLPLPSLTIQQAFPLSRQWWPSWDPRNKLNCVQTCIGSAKLTERIRSALERFEGDPPDSVQKYVLEQCRKWNLVWVGRNKVAPLECDEVEMLLGFPKNHTRGGGISRTDRYKSLGNSFQVDTVAYHLSVLKDIYPNGMKVLSLFSGIGGAEVALHRLGIKLKYVVSVEKCKANRDIVRSWWEQTNQTGTLIDYEDIQQLDAKEVEKIIERAGGFDLVIGGSPCNNLTGGNRVSRDGLEGKESALFYDYFRVLGLVKDFMRARQI